MSDVLRAARSAFQAKFLLVALTLSTAACSLGKGEGQIETDALFVGDCWNGGPFRLDPDFFAGMPFQRTLTVRVQHGGDLEEVSDGALILIDDIDRVRTEISAQGGSATFRVALPPAIVPPGYPIVIDPDPAIVHLTLYLNRACHAQNGTLYSVSGNITFHALFDGDPNESNEAQRLTDAEFSEIDVADPRNRMPGSTVVLDQTALHGYFRFFFKRGQPAQPFP
jgi:hypothetical protein